MTHNLKLFALSAAALIVLSAPTQAQEVDCENPMTQVEMNLCAAQAFEAADEDLNLAYEIARDMARQMDSYTPDLDPTNEVLLRDAQRAWIKFRDAACEAESTLARGGTMQPLLYSTCAERLTRQRAEDLRMFGEVN